MAAAAISKLKSHHHIFSSSSNGATSRHAVSKKTNDADCKRELDFIAHYKDDGKILSPGQISQDPRNKALGCSSSSLAIKDFELLKTLGTGMNDRILLRKCLRFSC